MHEAMARKPGRHVKILALAVPGADDGIAVEVILIIKAGHRRLAFRLLELREAMGESRPNHILEITVVDLEVEAARLAQGRHAARIPPALGAKRSRSTSLR